MIDYIYWPSFLKKKIRRKILKWVAGLSIPIFALGLVMGYGWRMKQVDKNYHLEIQKLKDRIIYYESEWMPIKQKSIKTEKRER